MDLLKPLIENKNEWKIKSLLIPPISLGFAFAIKK
jgi:hypothetical protein